MVTESEIMRCPRCPFFENFRALATSTTTYHYFATHLCHIGHLSLCTTWYHYVPLCTHMSYMYPLFTYVLHIPHVTQCPLWRGSHHPVTRCPFPSPMLRVALLRATRCRCGGSVTRCRFPSACPRCPVLSGSCGLELLGCLLAGSWLPCGLCPVACCGPLWWPVAGCWLLV